MKKKMTKTEAKRVMKLNCFGSVNAMTTPITLITIKVLATLVIIFWSFSSSFALKMMNCLSRWVSRYAASTRSMAMKIRITIFSNIVFVHSLVCKEKSSLRCSLDSLSNPN